MIKLWNYAQTVSTQKKEKISIGENTILTGKYMKNVGIVSLKKQKKKN